VTLWYLLTSDFIVRFICCDVIGSDVRPLSDEEISRLDTNEHYLNEYLNVEDVIILLFSKQCISSMQRDYLQSQPHNQVVGKLVSVLVRRSFADLKKFIEILYETGQDHIAQVINEGGGLCSFENLYNIMLVMLHGKLI